MLFSDLITPAGIVAAAALIVSLVQIVKAAFPAIDRRVSGALLAFVGTGVLYVAAGFVLPSSGPDQLLQVFAAWVAVAGLAIGIKSGAGHVGEVIDGVAGT
jgi:hypothetical protein